MPWMLIGDFNDVIEQSEKFGGNPVCQARIRAYLDCMNICRMIDLGFIGNRFTWANMRFSHQLIRERLDRAWANPDWKLLFPEAALFHLPRTSSDHCPLLLDLNPSYPRVGTRPFRMEKFWLNHPEFQNLVHQIWSMDGSNTSVCLDRTMSQAKSWSKLTFGDIFKRKKKLLARLSGIQNSSSYNHSAFLWNLEKHLIQEFEQILKMEEDLWFMKSRTNWITDGDRNTRYFHLSAVKHRSRNKIFGLKNQAGDWISDGPSIAFIAVTYFQNLFSTSLQHSFTDSFLHIYLDLDDSVNLDSIGGIPTEVEILKAVNSMKPFKAPGPDGTHPFFYQGCWPLVKDKVCQDIKDIFCTGVIPDKWNECLLALIPKVKSPEIIQQFRPIGLCNTSYKIVSKILVNRLKPWMDKLISPCQSSFISGRQGMDNVIILQELVYSFAKKSGKSGDMICKLDLEKAYDRLEWSFIREALIFFRFPMEIIDLIMSMVSSSSISVLVNGDKTKSFLPSRGIRQGDPLSPYLFIICMEFLSLKISTDMERGLWKGSKAGRRGPLLSHIFFADDLIFIGKATVENCYYLKNLLDFFCSRSGQCVNPSKSKLFFSKNVVEEVRDSLSTILGFSQTTDIGTYLGVPISAKKPTKSKCQFIIDKVRAKLAGWKSRYLSLAGRVTLTSSVLATIPNFYMQTMMLPASVHKELDQISRNFIWGSEPDSRKLHLVNWQTVTQPRVLGGLGIKSSKDANLAAMAKLNWRLYTEKNSLWVGLLRNKYNALNPHNPPSNSGSPMWKAITKGFDIFQAGIRWIPHNGVNILFWKDCWFSDTPLVSQVYGPHIQDFDYITVFEFLLAGVDAPDLIAYQLPKDILDQILAVPISFSSNRDDTLSWKGGLDGSFSPSHAYLIVRNLPPSTKDDWRWIWKSQTFPKIQTFIWLLSHERLKCFEFLNKLGITPSATCPRCHAAVESVEHLIRDCPVSVSILVDLLPGTFTQTQRDLDFSAWLKYNCKRKDSNGVLNIPWGVIFCFALWGIWLHRNQTLYKPHAYPVTTFRSLIIEKAVEFWALHPNHSPHYGQIRYFKWSKPSHPSIKLNTDGSVIGNGKAAGGGVFRDSNGNWILGFVRRIGSTDSLSTELWALRDGLKLAVDFQFTHIIVETDSYIASQLLAKPPIATHQLSSLLLDCRDLLQFIPHAIVNHTVREANMVADQLARMGHNLHQNFVILSQCPRHVKPFCVLDIMGFEVPRTR
ncbi:hypothetical protein SLE2022_131660 [Rubroshorea leprosula]